jgi:ribose 5-phosphate isomerase A
LDKKRTAAERALDFVADEMIVGLGTGSTTNYAIEGLARMVEEGLKVQGVPTSVATEQLALRLGIPLVTLEEVDMVDVTIDGADEVDPSLNLIKGMGGALLREKVVAFHSAEEIIIIDDSKLVKQLGTKSPLPVEVARFGHTKTRKAMQELGCIAELKGRDRPFITDNGNLVYECRFEGGIEDPELLEAELRLIPGVMESGLFIGLATKVVVATDDRVEVRTKR